MLRDADGRLFFGYDNTHFVSESAAWDKLKAEVTAGVCYWGRAVEQAKRELAKVEQEAALMTQALAKVCDQLDARSKTPNAAMNGGPAGATRNPGGRGPSVR